MEGSEITISNGKRKRASRSPASAEIGPSSIYRDGCRLYVGNLAYQATEQDMRALFADHSVCDVTVPINPRSNRAVGYAFVDLTTPLQAQTAIVSLSGRVVLERKVSVQLARAPQDVKYVAEPEEVQEPSKKRRNCASGFASHIKVEEAPELKFNQAADISCPPFQKLSITSTDHVWAEHPALKFAELWVKENAGPNSGEEQITKSLADLLHELDVPDSRLYSYASRRVQATLRTAKKVNVPEGCSSTTKVMVANLPYEVTEESLKALFSAYDQIEAKIALRPIPRFIVKKLQARGEPRKSRGFGFVTFTNEKMQQKAIIEMDGKEIEGRLITVKVAIDALGNDRDQSSAYSSDTISDGTRLRQ
jgi:RNA recognition motif-containing protein